jgi:restriction system protein
MPVKRRRRTGQVIKLLFEILAKYPEGLQTDEAFAKMRDSSLLTDYEKDMYETGSSRFEKIIHFGTVDCVKAGWLAKYRGRWVVTKSGQIAYDKEWNGITSNRPLPQREAERDIPTLKA